jgi:hypothetical protein
MSKNRSNLILTVIVLAVAGFVACGGPSDPSGEGVTLLGEFEGDSDPARLDAAGPIVVAVEEAPDISTTVAADGRFGLRGLPDGSFTLAFTHGGRTPASLRFDAVKPNEEIAIRVAMSANGNAIILLEEKRSGVGQGEVEFEGVIEEVLNLDPNGDSRFRIAGYLVIARAGETVINQGNQRRTVFDLLVGLRVHVEGRWLGTGSGTGQVVLAREINLREDGDDDPPRGCMISGGKVGGKIQLEGTVASGNATRFELRVNGNRAKGLVDVDASGATFKCVGSKKAPPNQCPAQVSSGAKVHVGGSLESCSASEAHVIASDVKVQK